MKTLFVFFFLLSSPVMASDHAEEPKHQEPEKHEELTKMEAPKIAAVVQPVEVLPPQESPVNCLKKKSYPCAVWAIGKGQIKSSAAEVNFSAGSLFEFKNANTIYLSTGWLWVKGEAAFTVQGRFGQVSADHKNEIWAQASDDAFIARAGDKALDVRALGGKESMLLEKGYEIRFTYVDRNFGMAEFTWPVVMDFASYLTGIQKTSGEDQVRQKAEDLASAIVAAAQSSASSQELALRRSLASVRKGPKDGEAEDPGRDLRLRRLFRIKSDFEE